jgi:hypothetical protein
MKYQKYSHTDIHNRFVAKFVDGPKQGVVPIERQAYACPYFVPLSGILGHDWGVIVNPRSERFGVVTFEHDDCGCVGSCPRGNQRLNQWLDNREPDQSA